jgi:hypothetical protein
MHSAHTKHTDSHTIGAGVPNTQQPAGSTAVSRPAASALAPVSRDSVHSLRSPPNGDGSIAAPSHDAIARRAFSIFENGGSRPGHCGHNWDQAQRELRALQTGHTP